LTREAKTRAGFRDGKLAAQIGISLLTLADVRSDSRKPMAKTMVKLRAFFYGPLIMRGEEELALELPRDRHLSRRGITSASQLAEAAIAHGMTPAWHNCLTHEISSCYFIPDEFFGAAWALAIHPVTESWLYQAMVFYSASIRGFFPLHPKWKRR
jgi:hypothetical protein